MIHLDASGFENALADLGRTENPASFLAHSLDKFIKMNSAVQAKDVLKKGWHFVVPAKNRRESVVWVDCRHHFTKRLHLDLCVLIALPRTLCRYVESQTEDFVSSRDPVFVSCIDHLVLLVAAILHDVIESLGFVHWSTPVDTVKQTHDEQAFVVKGILLLRVAQVVH